MPSSNQNKNYINQYNKHRRKGWANPWSLKLDIQSRALRHGLAYIVSQCHHRRLFQGWLGNTLPTQSTRRNRGYMHRITGFNWSWFLGVDIVWWSGKLLVAGGWVNAAATLDSKCNAGWSMSWMTLTVQATSQIVIATTYNAREAEMVVWLH